MKKSILRISTIMFAVILLFSACNKSNIKYGNSRIIGKWTLSSENSITEYNSERINTFETNPCLSDYTEVTVSKKTVSVAGTVANVHETKTITSTQEGFEPISIDTTYTGTKKFELTFNEDGTCVMKIIEKNLSISEYSSDFDIEYTGYWDWIDSYKEKAGIEINLVGMDGGYESYKIILIIESLDKKELIFNYTTILKENSESTSNYIGCYDPETGYIYPERNLKRTSTETSTGKTVMKK